MLSVENIDVFYGNVQALHNISLTVENNEIVSIIGSNGAGKSTLMKAIMGINKCKNGQIKFLDQNIANIKTHTVVEKGIAYVPEGREIFPEMSVVENLEMGAYSKKMSVKEIRDKIEEMYALFPRLKERSKQLAGSLSGGEQQMLAIGRGLMCDPKLIMFDEPSLGLAPVIVDEMFEIIVNVNKQKNIPVILVEQNAFMALNISYKTYVLETGHMRNEGKSKDLISDPQIKKAYLGG